MSSWFFCILSSIAFPNTDPIFVIYYYQSENQRSMTLDALLNDNSRVSYQYVWRRQHGQSNMQMLHHTNFDTNALTYLNIYIYGYNSLVSPSWMLQGQRYTYPIYEHIFLVSPFPKFHCFCSTKEETFPEKGGSIPVVPTPGQTCLRLSIAKLAEKSIAATGKLPIMAVPSCWFHSRPGTSWDSGLAACWAWASAGFKSDPSGLSSPYFYHSIAWNHPNLRNHRSGWRQRGRGRGSSFRRLLGCLRSRRSRGRPTGSWCQVCDLTQLLLGASTINCPPKKEPTKRVARNEDLRSLQS